VGGRRAGEMTVLTNGLTCLPMHGGARDDKVLVTHPMTDH
jgi:hypothetical protein